ncbi:MAG TPA: CBS domain-containing protein [Methylomirabilota bacterium]|nr:CBS domain-containing protein [Methylomirabilota bacterium]
MSRPAVTIHQDAAARGAWALMRNRGIRHLPVVNAEGGLVGIVTDRDLRQLVFDPAIRARLVASARSDLTVGAVMTRAVITTCPETPILEATRLMHERKIGALPVVEGDRVTGIFTESDAFAALVQTLGTLAIPRALRGAIATRRNTA